MTSKIKTTLLLLILLSGILCLTSFRPQISASIVGDWTQTGIQQVTRRGDAPGADTAIYHPKGYAITFTADGRYHYTAPYGHRADGTYSVSGNTLKEDEPANHSSSGYTILTLTDHALVTRSIGAGLQSRVAIETVTTYAR